MSFPFPVAFVFGNLDRWADVAGAETPADPDAMPERFRSGEEAWTMQTYLRLRRAGHPVSLVRKPPADRICVVHYDDLYLSDLPFNSYLVVIQADRPRAAVCEQCVVQNPSLADRPSVHFMPHWPQPGLLPRDPSRGDRVETLGYLGRATCLAPDLQGEAFRRELAGLGMELVIREDRWHDCRDIDVIVAVRDLPEAILAVKPASKLTNAWLAGCPALLGREPGFDAMRQSDLDFIPVASREEILRSLAMLKESPERYRAMVDNGRRRAEEFTAEALTRRWTQLLTGPIADDFRRWRRGVPGLRRVSRVARFALRSLRHRKLRKSFPGFSQAAAS